MSIAFEAAFVFVVGAEGIYSADPRDRGNWTGGRVGVGELRGTKYGISAAAFPYLDIRSVTLEQAKALYRAHYWDAICGDAMPLPVAIVTFDMAVNQGVHAAIVTLQHTVGATADGWIGQETIGLAGKNPAQDTIIEFSARRALAYAGNADVATDGLGWMRRVFKLFSQLKDAPNVPDFRNT